MRPNPDRPSTWVRYRERLCSGCEATCCRLPLEVRAADLVRLGLATEDEAQAPKRLSKRLIRERIVRTFRSATGLYLLEPQANGDCQFLGKDRLCTVYEKRPDTCRGFPHSLGPRVGFCPYTPKSAPAGGNRRAEHPSR